MSRGVVIALTIGLGVLLLWHVEWLNKCRYYNNSGLVGAYYFLQAGCPIAGPYAPNSNVVAYALFHPFSD